MKSGEVPIPYIISEDFSRVVMKISFLSSKTGVRGFLLILIYYNPIGMAWDCAILLLSVTVTICSHGSYKSIFFLCIWPDSKSHYLKFYIWPHLLSSNPLTTGDFH